MSIPPASTVLGQPARSRSWGQLGFYLLWAAATAVLGWLLIQGRREFDLTLLLWAGPPMLALTVGLLWRLRRPEPSLAVESASGRPGNLGARVLIAVLLLMPLRALVGRSLLWAVPVAAVAVLVWLRPRFTLREWLYSIALALVSGIAGLGAGWITYMPLPAWAALQVALVLPGLLAGWAILRRTGLWAAGVGGSLFLTGGVSPALRGFVQGMILGLPWVLFGILLGGSNADAWVKVWWQPLAAIQPGIAEEAWGRVLLVPLLFLAFRPAGGERQALHAAVIVMAYWFAQLHTAGDVGSLFSTVLIGTLYSLPVSYLWLYRGLETAIGFHFMLDLIRFSAAYFMNRGLWFGA